MLMNELQDIAHCRGIPKASNSNTKPFVMRCFHKIVCI